jgi:hypothetical protein
MLGHRIQVNRLLLDLVAVGERHGIRFPREFGLFVKQLLVSQCGCDVVAVKRCAVSANVVQLSRPLS